MDQLLLFSRQTKLTKMSTYSKVPFDDPLTINETDSCDANDIVISGISGKISKSFNVIQQK